MKIAPDISHAFRMDAIKCHQILNMETTFVYNKFSKNAAATLLMEFQKRGQNTLNGNLKKRPQHSLWNSKKVAATLLKEI
jgi:hypothetical protein